MYYGLFTAKITKYEMINLNNRLTCFTIAPTEKGEGLKYLTAEPTGRPLKERLTTFSATLSGKK
jgi:hypothetical protein